MAIIGGGCQIEPKVIKDINFSEVTNDTSLFRILFNLIKKWKIVKQALCNKLQFFLFSIASEEQAFSTETYINGMYGTSFEHELTEEERKENKQYKIAYSYDIGSNHTQNHTFAGQANGPTYRARLFKKQKRINGTLSKIQYFWIFCGEALSDSSCEEARQFLISELATYESITLKEPYYITEDDMGLQKSFL